MAVSLVANVAIPGAPNGGTSSSIDTTGATLLVIHVADADGVATTVSDSKGNSWTALTARQNSLESQLYYCASPTVGSGHTFTTSASSAFPAGQVLAFSGVDASPFDTQNGNTTTDSTIQTGSVTPAEDGSLLVAGVGHVRGVSPTIGSGFTVTDSNALSGGNYYGAGAAYLVQTTAAAINPTWTLDSSGVLAATIAVFGPSAGGATGTSATTNANDTSAASGTTTVVGTSATTNAADTSSASGSVGSAVSGSAATTNANDTAAAAGTTTVTGTAATTNAADTSAAAGWAGTVTGEVAATNANDYATAIGIVGIAIDEPVYLAPGPAKWYARVGDRDVVGTKREIEALLQQLAQQHAEEDETLIERGEQPKKRSVRVVSPGRASVAPAKAETRVYAAPKVLEKAGIGQEQVQRMYQLAYTMHMHREAIRQDDEDVADVVRHIGAHRASLAATLAQVIEKLQRMR